MTDQELEQSVEQTEVTDDIQEDSTSNEPVDQIETQEAAGETPEEEEQGAEVEQPTDEPSTEQYKTVTELAEATGMSIDDFLGNIKSTVEVDGEAVTLAELQKGHLRETDYRKKTMELADLKRAAQEQLEQKQAQADSYVMGLQEIFQGNQAAFNNDYNAVDWQELRGRDAAEYSAMKQDFDERGRGIQAQAQRAMKLHSQLMNQRETERQETVNREYAEIHESIPDWDDHEADIVEFVQNTHGIGFDEFSGVLQHREKLSSSALMKMAYTHMSDLRELNALKASMGKATKKVTDLPPLVRGGVKKNPNSVDQNQLSKLKAKMKKSGSIEDSMAYQNALNKARK